MRLSPILLLMMLAAPPSVGQTTNWDAHTLSDRGTVRFSELLQTLEPMRYWSTDRYTARMVGTGMGGPHTMGPSVLLDGLPFTPRFMDRNEYEIIPVSPADVENVEFRPGFTMLSDGRFADGVFNIRTKKPTGWSVRGLVGLVNETGDPGPVKYTNPLAKNIDRSGPTSAIRASWGNRSWYLQAGLDTDAFHMTDQRIEGRVWRIFAGGVKPVVSHVSQTVRISHSSPQNSLELGGGQSSKNNFLFDELAGLEWPVTEDRKWFKGRFVHALGSNWEAGISGGYDDLKSSNLSAQIELPSALAIQDANAELRLAYATPSFSANWAVGGRHSRLEQANTGWLRSQDIVHVRSGLDWGLATKARIKVNGSLSVPRLDVSQPAAMSYVVGGEFDYEKRRMEALKMGLTLRSDRVEDVWTTLDLVESGVRFGAWAPNVISPIFDSRTESVEAFLFSSSSLGRHSMFWMDLRARRLWGLILPERTFHQVGSDVTFTSDSNFRSGRAGTVISPRIGLTFRSEASRAELSYQFIRTVADGDVVFWKHFSGLSPHHIKGSFATDPNPRLHLFASVSINNQMNWPEYPSLDRSWLPGFVQMDASISKDFWGDRLHLNISAINLLNREIVRHPAAVDEQMAIRVGVLVNFSHQTSNYP